MVFPPLFRKHHSEFQPVVVVVAALDQHEIQGTTTHRYKTFILNFMANPMIFRCHFKFPYISLYLESPQAWAACAFNGRRYGGWSNLGVPGIMGDMAPLTLQIVRWIITLQRVNNIPFSA